METIAGHLYDYPQYYDLVFGSDWKAEFDFLQACFARHVDGRVRRVFEPACGTGRLVYRLAKGGYRVSGLDLNDKAVDYCNARLRRHGFDESCFVADMTDFALPRPVDAAFNMINSFRHLQSEAAASAHLDSVGRLHNREAAVVQAAISGVEAMHWSALLAAMGENPVPVAFVPREEQE